MPDTDFEAPGLSSTSSAPPRVQEISSEISGFIAKNGWKRVDKTEFEGSVGLRLYLDVRNVLIDVTIIVNNDPLYIAFYARLPMRCQPEYELLVDDYLSEYNYGQSIGVMQRNKHDGTLEYQFTFSVAHSFFIEDFELYFNSCLYSAAIAYPEVSKLCAGRLTRAQLAEVKLKLQELTRALDN
jgi:hypothetical protein